MMDDVDFTSGGRSEIFETDDGVHRSSPTTADALDLAVCRQANSASDLRPLERLSGRWTFRSMPQDVNLTVYGKQFAGEWPPFRVEMECDGVANATPSAGDFFADAKDSTTAPRRSNTFIRQCVAYAGRIFTWDFYRTVCLYFLPIAEYRNRR